MWNPSKTVVEIRDTEDAPWVFYDQILKNTDANTVFKYESEASISNTMRIRHISLWELLCDPKLWRLLTDFLLLSVVGIIITYASYLKPKDDVVLSGLVPLVLMNFLKSLWVV